MKTLEEILARKAEIRTLLQSDKEVDVAALTKEVKELNEAQKTIEERNALFGTLEEPKAAQTQTQTRSVAQTATAQHQVLDNTPVLSEQRKAFTAYLEKRADIAGGSLTTDSGFVVIPEEIVTEILKLKETEYNLDQFVTIKKVTNGSGKYPVVRQSSVAALPEVAELAANPELAVKPFFMLAYDIKTYRGYFLISKEAIEDSAIDVLGELKLWMARTIAATRNAAILNVIKNGGPGEDGVTTKFSTVDAAGTDGLKDAINLSLLPNYEHNVAIMSQSAFNAIDKIKDGNGNYLLQSDIKEASTKRLLGARVEVLPDEMLPNTAGGAHQILIGNLKDGIVLFDRSQYQASWTDYMHFGEALMVAVRQDARIVDKKSVIVVNFTPAAEPAGV